MATETMSPPLAWVLMTGWPPEKAIGVSPAMTDAAVRWPLWMYVSVASRPYSWNSPSRVVTGTIIDTEPITGFAAASGISAGGAAGAALVGAPAGALAGGGALFAAGAGGAGWQAASAAPSRARTSSSGRAAR